MRIKQKPSMGIVLLIRGQENTGPFVFGLALAFALNFKLAPEPFAFTKSCTRFIRPYLIDKMRLNSNVKVCPYATNGHEAYETPMFLDGAKIKRVRFVLVPIWR